MAQYGALSAESVLELVYQRELARQRRDWVWADSLRETLASNGVDVMDTPRGPKIDVSGPSWVARSRRLLRERMEG